MDLFKEVLIKLTKYTCGGVAKMEDVEMVKNPVRKCQQCCSHNINSHNCLAVIIIQQESHKMGWY